MSRTRETIGTGEPLVPSAGEGRGAPADARLLGLLDPAVEVLRGALAYHDAPAALPDDQPVPSVRVRRRVGAPGLRVALERYRDDDRLDTEELLVDRMPIDHAAALPRRRVHPAPTTVLHLTDRSGRQADEPASDRAVVLDHGAAGDQRVVLSSSGPGREDLQVVLAAARRHRLVVIEKPLVGDRALLAAMVLQLVAGGTPCWCPAGFARTLEGLAPGLRAELVFDRSGPAEDDLLLASRAAIQKRAAWADHDLRLGWAADDEARWRPRLRAVPWPAVSVVLVSRRPALLSLALPMIAAQRGVELEVIVAVHGGGDLQAVEEVRRAQGLEGRVSAVPAAVPFGAVLNHAVGLASSPVVLKWDDDDLYGPRHVQDLLIARRQTGAALVGKAAEFVYFDGSGEVIWRMPGRAESPSMGIAGGTFLTDRAVLDEVGGYPDVGRAVDHHLKVRLRDRGLHPFRTHGFGFALRRHGLGHTWEASDEQVRAKAIRTFSGLPEVLQLEDAARHTVLPHDG